MDWKALISTVAPYLGAAIGGPIGASAVGIVADALGLSDKTEASVKAALSGVTPEQMLAIKTADQDFQAKMTALGYDHIDKLAELAVKDMDSARNREIQVKDNTNRNLAYAYTVGYFGLIGVVMTVGIKPEVSEMMNVLIGVLTAAQASIMGYYYGSSRGSADKTELLAQSMPPK
jgi:uncharacterized membrane protein